MRPPPHSFFAVAPLLGSFPSVTITKSRLPAIFRASNFGNPSSGTIVITVGNVPGRYRTGRSGRPSRPSVRAFHPLARRSGLRPQYPSGRRCPRDR